MDTVVVLTEGVMLDQHCDADMHEDNAPVLWENCENLTIMRLGQTHAAKDTGCKKLNNCVDRKCIQWGRGTSLHSRHVHSKHVCDGILSVLNHVC